MVIFYNLATWKALLSLTQLTGISYLSHDNMFHSVLGLFGVQTGVYQPQLDIFHSCRPGA